MWTLKNNTNSTIQKIETDSQTEKKNKLLVTKGENQGGGINQEHGVNRYKVL